MGTKAEIQHFVHFVDHQLLDILGFQGAVHDKVDQPPRRGHDDVGPVAQFSHLAFDVLTAVNANYFDARVGRQLLNRFHNLHHKFAGGHQDQLLGQAVFGVFPLP